MEFPFFNLQVFCYLLYEFSVQMGDSKLFCYCRSIIIITTTTIIITIITITTIIIVVILSLLLLLLR